MANLIIKISDENLVAKDFCPCTTFCLLINKNLQELQILCLFDKINLIYLMSLLYQRSGSCAQFAKSVITKIDESLLVIQNLYAPSFKELLILPIVFLSQHALNLHLP
jgi:hypothetical protein